MSFKPITNSVITVSSAGTRVVLSSTSHRVKGFILQAHEDNVGDIYYGDVTVSSTNGVRIGARDRLIFNAEPVNGTFEDINLDALYIDAETSGNKILLSLLE